MFRKIKDFLFKNTSTRQTIAKNSFWLGVGNIGGKLLRAIIVLYAARVLGAENWGVFSYALTIIGFLTILLDLGINNIVTRDIAKTKDAKSTEFLSTSLLVKFALLAFGLVLTIFVIPHFITVQATKDLLPLVSLVLFFDTIREFGFALIRGLEKMEREAGLLILTNLGIAVFGLAFLLFSPTVLSLSVAYVIGTGLGAIATIITIRVFLRNVFRNFSKNLIKPIILSAWPFAISGLLGSLMISTDILILGWLRPVTDVGYYSAAQKVVTLFYILPAIIALSVLPSFVRFAGKDNEKFRLMFERLLKTSYMLAIPLALGGIFLGSKIITFLFGSQYLSSTTSFQLLIATLVIDFPAIIFANAIFSYNRQKSLAFYSALGSLSNVLFDLLLIPFLGIAGAALATLLAQTIGNIYLWRIMKKINPFQILPYLKNVLFAAVLMSAGIFFLSLTNLHLLLVIAISGFIYLFALMITKDALFGELKRALRPEEA